MASSMWLLVREGSDTKAHAAIRGFLIGYTDVYPLLDIYNHHLQCDLDPESPYLSRLRSEGIQTI